MTVAWIVAFVGLSTLTLLTALAVVGTLRRTTAALEQAEVWLRADPGHMDPGGLAPGTPVPEFVARDDAGEPISSAHFHGRESVLVFLSSDCPPCRTFVDDLRQEPPPYTPANLLLVVDASAEGEFLVDGIDATVIRQRGREVAEAFRSSATPHAFVIDTSGTVVATGTPNTVASLRELVAALGGEEVSARRKDEFVSA